MYTVLPVPPSIKRPYTPVGLMLCLCFSSVIGAQRPDGVFFPFEPRVRVIVSAPEGLKSEITSYLTRELRSIPSVTIADSLHDYEIHIVAGIPRNSQGMEIGVSIAYLVTKVQQAERAIGLLRHMEPAYRETFETLYKEVHTIEKFGLFVGTANDVQNTCRKLVAQIDTDLIEPDRQARENLDKFVRDQQPRTSKP